MSKNVMQYETTYIINAAVEESTIEETVNKFTELLKEQNAEILKMDRVGRRRLAYPIEKKTTGYYVTVEYKAETKTVAVFERNLQLDDYILRYLTIQIDAKILESRANEAKKKAVEAQAAE